MLLATLHLRPRRNERSNPALKPHQQHFSPASIFFPAQFACRKSCTLYPVTLHVVDSIHLTPQSMTQCSSVTTNTACFTNTAMGNHSQIHSLHRCITSSRWSLLVPRMSSWARLLCSHYKLTTQLLCASTPQDIWQCVQGLKCGCLFINSTVYA